MDVEPYSLKAELLHLRHGAENLCELLIATGSGGNETPVYVLLPDEVPGLAIHPSCGGFTLPNLDLVFRAEIGNRWRGRGWCVVIVAPEPSIRAKPEGRREVQATAIHELAHVLTCTYCRETAALDPELEEKVAVQLRKEVLATISKEDRKFDRRLANTGEAVPRPPFDGHGLCFMRNLLHLASRAAAAGYRFEWREFCAGEPYGLRDVRTYADALGDEPTRLADATFREINALPPPKAFADLWFDDEARWYQTARLKEMSL